MEVFGSVNPVSSKLPDLGRGARDRSRWWSWIQVVRREVGSLPGAGSGGRLIVTGHSFAPRQCSPWIPGKMEAL